jgi:fatty-acid desaturase
MMHGVLSATSIAHRVGSKQFKVDDESRNNWLVVILTFGYGWHNNHHRFPKSARAGLRAREVDIAAWLIEGLEKIGLARNVVRVSHAQIENALMGARMGAS